ncbi:MAG: PilZ domain-containing protein [Gammaproteobacteria bacterium]
MSLVFEPMYWGKTYSEKRDYVRMNVPAPIQVKTLSEKISIKGHTKNFNSQGVLFSSPKALAVGTEIATTINPGDPAYELANHAKIVRCILDDHNTQNFWIAAKFI